jgi:hypothetical protein
VLRFVAAVVLVAHGAIHLIGFVVPWKVATLDDFPYRTTALAGSIELGDPGARAIGFLWLLLALGFVAAGIGVWRRAGWSLPVLAALSITSLAVCILGLPESVAGIVLNAAILALLVMHALVEHRPRGASSLAR